MAKKELLNNDALTLRVAEPVVDILDEASDVIENQVDRFVTVTKNNPLIVVGALILGAGIGAAVAWKIADKKISLKYDEILLEEIAKTKEFYSRLNKAGVFETPESAVEALVPEEVVEAVQAYQGREPRVPYNNPKDIVVKDPRPPVNVEVEKVEVSHNVFVQAATDPRDWDYNHEIAQRTGDKPYVISFDEFDAGEEGHEQQNLSYYVDDNTLVDERDAPIDNTEYVVGDDNLLRFGHGSNDKNVVYVRNENIDTDFEIVRALGSYKRDVLGLDDDDPELRHSHRRPNRRSWRADE